ncbi:MAG: DUF6076 domain-containing protein [Huintestinicola sp.]
MNTIYFSAGGSNNFHKMELAKTLLHFTEYDFTFFWEQCIETGRNARKTGRISRNIAALAENAAAKCHPYVEVCMQTEFSSVVLDCIIAYICHSEGIGLEELWARCITPKSLYEKAIFRRVSEYKTGKGINQWINIVRMQEYARSKLAFIYESENNLMLTADEYRTRREYFDLAFSVAANETGCHMSELPSIKKYSPSLLPDSAFMMGRVSKAIYRRLSEVLSDAEPVSGKHLNDHTRDQAALDAFSYVKDMPRPAEIDMKFALESITALPETVYVPDSFKAMIDLEFSCMSEEGIYLSKCPRCGRYFVREPDERNPYCNRVNPSGKTCTELIDQELSAAADIHNDIPPVTEDITANTNEDIPAAVESTAEDGVFTETVHPVYSPPPEEKQPEPVPEDIPTEIPKETEKRCQKVYNMLYKRIGKLMSDSEFREWSRYLSDMKRNVRIGESNLRQLDEFLSFWESEAKKPRPKHNTKLSRNSMKAQETQTSAQAASTAEAEEKTSSVPSPDTISSIEVPENKPAAAENEEQLSGGSDTFDSIAAETDKKLEAADEARISPDAEEAVVFKPFNPPKYNTVLEAMMDGKYKSEELLSEKGSVSDEDLEEIKVNGRKITLPSWEKISRKP